MIENKKILIVEDEQKVASFIKKGLHVQDFEADIATNGYEGKKLFSENVYDLVILDIGLPDMSGLDVCEHIRSKNTKIPILMLTALGSVSDKLSGFEVGTDDYLVKPFDFMELLVRVKALLKRTKEIGQPAQVLQVSDLELDLKEKVAVRAGKRVELTAKEFGLLEYLMTNRGRVVSKPTLQKKFGTSTLILAPTLLRYISTIFVIKLIRVFRQN